MVVSVAFMSSLSSVGDFTAARHKQYAVLPAAGNPRLTDRATIDRAHRRR